MVSYISTFYEDVPDEFLQFARIEYPQDATKSTPKCTGITPHLKLMDDTEAPRHKFDILRVDIKGDMEDMID